MNRLSTGSVELDRLLGGGLPIRSVNMIAGEPGAGKTLFALQMLFHLAGQGKRGLYFTTLSEPALKLLGYMQQFSFFDAGLAKEAIVFADLGSVMRTKGPEAVLAEITTRVERESPALVVIDSFKAFRDSLPEASEVRAFVYDLAVHAASWGAASLLVGEYTEAEIAENAEFAIADGIIRFTHQHHELTAVREVEIHKIRGADYATGRHFFEIDASGMSFFPRVRAPDTDLTEPDWQAVRVPTGVAGLDDMLGGGFPRATSTVVQGGTGTGKTLLGLRFLIEGAQRGEAGVLFTLEETAQQLRGIARSLGWDLASFEQQGLLTLSYVSPIELSTDRFLDRARRLVEQVGARRAVLDSLTSLGLGVLSPRRFDECVYALTKHLRALGVTLTMNLEIADLLGSAQLSGHGISFTADNVILLKYVERDGRLERGIAVLKSRGVAHATDVRTLRVHAAGIDVGDAYDGLRGVLTGLPVPLPGGGGAVTSPSGQSLGRALYDIAHALESAEDSDRRVLHVLELLRTIVPMEQCALLHVQPGREPRLVAAPSVSPEEPAQVTERLLRLFGLFAEDSSHSPTPLPSSLGRLAVPLIGLDEVIGVLEIRSAHDAYSVEHLRALSVVAAQLAAHLVILRARRVEADRARELNEARRLAEAANRAKDEFLALVSLELKTPLNTTLTWAHSLGADDLEPPARAQAVDGIERAVRAQAKLIDEILDHVGIASAALRLDLRAVEPARLIRATLDGLRLQAEAREIRLEAALDPSVTGLIVDPDRFEQIVSNLVANAIKFTPNGGSVEVHLERADDQARIRVIDHGTRIAPEVLPHLFESFRVERAPSDRTRGAFGVGLAIVKNLVERHGGSIRAESAGETSGATFTVELPLAADARALTGIRILVVDDDDDFRDALCAVLERRGAEVMTVSSVAAALAALERWKPDVLLSELAMPRQSGYDLIRALEVRHPTLPAAALTKFSSADESARAVQAGFQMHLVKPVDVEALVAAVSELAGRSFEMRARAAAGA